MFIAQFVHLVHAFTALWIAHTAFRGLGGQIQGEISNLVTTHLNFNINFRVFPGLLAEPESINEALKIPSAKVI